MYFSLVSYKVLILDCKHTFKVWRVFVRNSSMRAFASSSVTQGHLFQDLEYSLIV